MSSKKKGCAFVLFVYLWYLVCIVLYYIILLYSIVLYSIVFFD